MSVRLKQLDEILRTIGLEPDFVEEDGGLLASCGETVLHVQSLGTPDQPYVRARNLVLADVMGTPEVYAFLARENLSTAAGAYVHEGAGGVVRLGGVYPDDASSRSAIPSVLWALATGGERAHEAFGTRLGGYTWSEAGREDHDLGALPAGEPLRLRRPADGEIGSIAEARRHLDEHLSGRWPEGEHIRLGDGHHALRTGDATHEVTLAPRPFRTTVRILTRLVGDLDPGPMLHAQINHWNEGLGYAAFAYHEDERMLVCASSLPGTFLAEGTLDSLLQLHAALAEEHSGSVLETIGGRPALEAQADRS